MKHNRLCLSTFLIAFLCMTSLAEVKVMGFNMRYNSPKDTGETSWDVRKTAIQRFIREVKPDVVSVGEARESMRKDLKELLPEYGQIEIPGTGSRSGANTIIIYNKNTVSLLDEGAFFHSPTPDKPSKCWNHSTGQWRGTCWGKFKEKTTGKDFYFFATHLCLGLKNHDLEAKLNSAMLNVIKMHDIAGDEAPVFIAGDMNASREADDVRRWGLQPFHFWMKDGREVPVSNKEPTFNGFGKMELTPRHVIDFIYYRNADVKKFENFNKPNWGVPYISDHYPNMVTADL
ncbi:endonuclease/exonuclease/phosphatase family protein [uncultured Duncaniella sp.]|uniref:endonuclease/exonuclease/phosphatase family protein n=1 Tax=uncultured Duncaniella sp. TaxID=2768039 RepID=UPI0026F3F4B4|nr:endonuclease/exonuclease/phosphatase family protein [uncultured Duncaniella sp.]